MHKISGVRERIRLAIVVSHPIQHFVSFYRALARHDDLNLHVLFGAPIGVKPYYDEEMRSKIAWNMDMLSGYSHEFLNPREGLSVSFRSINSPKIGERLAAFGPDAVIVYGYSQMNALRALLWGRRNRVPIIMISDSERLQHRAGWKTTVKESLLPHLFRRCSAFLSVGDRNEEYYRHYGAQPVAIFRSPFTIDEDRFRAAASDRNALRHAAREELGIPDDATVLTFVGKLSPRKRPGDLVRALKILKERGQSQYHALFLGNGELFDQLSQEAIGAELPATFAGFVNVDRLPKLYAASDVLVHPSELDPHPLICSEAACMGLPMILSDLIGAVGTTDIAREGENAIVFECGDVASLADAVMSLGEDDRRRKAMASRSKEIFDELDMRCSVAGVEGALAYVLN